MSWIRDEERVCLSIKVGAENQFAFSLAVSISRVFKMVILKVVLDLAHYAVPFVWRQWTGDERESQDEA